MSFLLGKRASVKPTPDRDSGRPPSSNNIPIGNNINNHDNKSSGTDLSCSYDSYVSEESDDDSYDGESNSWTPKKKGFFFSFSFCSFFFFYSFLFSFIPPPLSFLTKYKQNTYPHKSQNYPPKKNKNKKTKKNKKNKKQTKKNKKQEKQT